MTSRAAGFGCGGLHLDSAVDVEAVIVAAGPSAVREGGHRRRVRYDVATLTGRHHQVGAVPAVQQLRAKFVHPGKSADTATAGRARRRRPRCFQVRSAFTGSAGSMAAMSRSCSARLRWSSGSTTWTRNRRSAAARPGAVRAARSGVWAQLVSTAIDAMVERSDAEVAGIGNPLGVVPDAYLPGSAATWPRACIESTRPERYSVDGHRNRCRGSFAARAWSTR